MVHAPFIRAIQKRTTNSSIEYIKCHPQNNILQLQRTAKHLKVKISNFFLVIMDSCLIYYFQDAYDQENALNVEVLYLKITKTK